MIYSAVDVPLAGQLRRVQVSLLLRIAVVVLLDAIPPLAAADIVDQPDVKVVSEESDPRPARVVVETDPHGLPRPAHFLSPFGHPRQIRRHRCPFRLGLHLLPDLLALQTGVERREEGKAEQSQGGTVRVLQLSIVGESIFGLFLL